MTAQLRKSLLVLVILNLVFVQITGAVSLAWMLPLLGLALAAPLLWPFQRFLTYRIAWNVALMTIFLLLILDVRRSGIRYMLEDGLILAAFCQVHVLNNLIKQRRPDLVFFNSFLIALVTGFFCQDFVYSVVFLAYAMVFVVALGISSSGTVGRFPTRELPDLELRHLLRRSARQGAVILTLTGFVFAFWPRDFNREGLVNTDLAAAAVVSEVAFSDQIRLDRKHNAVKSNRVVMRVRLRRGTRGHISPYWRGATFTNLRPHGWWADTNVQPPPYVTQTQLDERWERYSATEFRRPGHRTGAELEIVLTDSRTRSLFAPLEVNRIEFDCLASPALDGNFRIPDTGRQPREIHYSIRLNLRGDKQPKVRRRQLRDHRRHNPRYTPPEALALSREIRRLLPPDAKPRQEVEVIRSYLAGSREYLLPGEDGAVDNLREFIAGKGGGHCEYFATTMVMLLRLRGIPCRMVSGYLAHEWDEDGRELTVRSNHAHAWVEVWDQDSGWLTLDPTPAQEEFSREDNSLMAGVQGFLRRVWATVTGFDAKSRDAVLLWTKEKLAAAGMFIKEHPVWFVFTLVGLFFARRWWRARRQPFVDPAVADYLRVLTKLGLSPRIGETPRELLARARTEDIPDDRLESLAGATSRHELCRYG